MIGIGITTFNRNKVFYNTLEQIKKFAPKDSKIVIVDDGSKEPIIGSTFRFEINKGTPVAKNKCFELLDDCEHIFLFDDDCYPIKKDWHKPYINSGIKHLNFTFKYSFEVKGKLKIHENPNGCMMYFHRDVLEKAGGFDTGFMYYGYWHGAMSNRIHNIGLTPHPFMDVLGSEKLFCSMDAEKTVTTSRPDRNRFLRHNKVRYHAEINSKKYYPYKNTPKVWYSNPYSTSKNIGRALNEFCSLVPDNDWICLQDGDMMYLTPDWGLQIEKTISLHGDKFSLLGCVTNRLGRAIQRHEGLFSENNDVKIHYDIAKELSEKKWCQVEDITKKKYVAGMFMLFPKKLWNKVKFRENSTVFDDQFSIDIIRSGGKLGLMKGLYVYHAYRIWSDKPIGDNTHLK